MTGKKSRPKVRHRMVAIAVYLAVLFSVLSIFSSIAIICYRHITLKNESNKVIAEIVARKLNKKPDKLSDDDYNKVEDLVLSGEIISDIKPLARLTNLRRLEIAYLRVPVKKLPDWLPQWISRYLIGPARPGNFDITALGELINLQELTIRYTDIRDIKPLENLKKLQTLHLCIMQVGDIRSLANLTNLRSVHLNSTQVSDIRALAGLIKLQELYLNDTQVHDIIPLEGLINLKTLNLNSTEVGEIRPLAYLKNLEVLQIKDTHISDISVLAGLLNLNSLNLDRTQVRDIESLMKLTNLRTLHINGAPVSNKQITELKKALPDLMIISDNQSN